MRESRTYGSVRGAGSNLRPYATVVAIRLTVGKFDPILARNERSPAIAASSNSQLIPDSFPACGKRVRNTGAADIRSGPVMWPCDLPLGLPKGVPRFPTVDIF